MLNVKLKARQDSLNPAGLFSKHITFSQWDFRILS